MSSDLLGEIRKIYILIVYDIKYPFIYHVNQHFSTFFTKKNIMYFITQFNLKTKPSAQ